VEVEMRGKCHLQQHQKILNAWDKFEKRCARFVYWKLKNMAGRN